MPTPLRYYVGIAQLVGPVRGVWAALADYF